MFPPVVNLPRQPVPPPGQAVVAAPRPIAVPRFRLVQQADAAFGSYGGANGHLSQDNWVDLSPFCSRFEGEIGYGQMGMEMEKGMGMEMGMEMGIGMEMGMEMGLIVFLRLPIHSGNDICGRSFGQSSDYAFG